jgi:hypothetical protein
VNRGGRKPHCAFQIWFKWEYFFDEKIIPFHEQLPRSS